MLPGHSVQEIQDTMMNNPPPGLGFADYIVADNRPEHVDRTSMADSIATGTQVSGISLDDARTAGPFESLTFTSTLGNRWLYNEDNGGLHNIKPISRRTNFDLELEANSVITSSQNGPPEILFGYQQTNDDYSPSEERLNLEAYLMEEAQELDFELVASYKTIYADDEYKEDLDDLIDGVVTTYFFQVDTYDNRLIGGEMFDEFTGQLTRAYDEYNSAINDWVASYGIDLGYEPNNYVDNLTGTILEYDYTGQVILKHYDDFSFGDALVVDSTFSFDKAPLFEAYISVNGETHTLFETDLPGGGLGGASNGIVPSNYIFQPLGEIGFHEPDVVERNISIFGDVPFDQLPDAISDTSLL